MAERVVDQLRRPVKCDNCSGSFPELVHNRIVYGRDKGEWPLIWYCRKCKATVSCHPGTSIPMGYMATSKTRKLRQEVHKVFDRLWLEGWSSRDRAYRWLASQMHLTKHQAHISRFNSEQCRLAIKLCKERLEELKMYDKGYTYTRGRKVEAHLRKVQRCKKQKRR